MKFIRIQAIVLFWGLAMTTGAATGNDDYRCTIDRLSLPQGDTGATYDLYKRNFVGKQFTIERVSGIMAGVMKNSYSTRPQVIDRGSQNNSYKVVTTIKMEQGAGAGSNIHALTVLEHEQGTKKPFVYLNNEVVFFGHCEHF